MKWDNKTTKRKNQSNELNEHLYNIGLISKDELSIAKNCYYQISRINGQVIFKTHRCKKQHCITCENIKSKKYAYRLFNTLEHNEKKMNYQFITLTLPNVPLKNLTDSFWDNFLKVFNLFKANCFKDKTFPESYFKKVETTFSYEKQEYNIHLHLLVGLEEKWIDWKLLRKFWTNSYNKVFGTNYESLNVDFKKTQGATFEISKYTSKEFMFNTSRNKAIANLYKDISRYKNSKEYDKLSYKTNELNYLKTISDEEFAAINDEMLIRFFKTFKQKKIISGYGLFDKKHWEKIRLNLISKKEKHPFQIYECLVHNEETKRYKTWITFRNIYKLINYLKVIHIEKSVKWNKYNEDKFLLKDLEKIKELYSFGEDEQKYLDKQIVQLQLNESKDKQNKSDSFNNNSI